MLLMLPTLIVRTSLLSFITRHHIGESAGIRGLKEVPIKDATMRRRFVVTCRQNSYLSPASNRLFDLLTDAERRS